MDYIIDQSANARELGPLLNYTISDYAPEPYIVPDAISNTHNQPRFGYTNNFDALIGGNSDETKDYVLGVIIGAMIILIVAMLWFFAIVCLKISGQERVGFLAGRLVRPYVSTDDKEEKEGVEIVMDEVDEAIPVNSVENNATDDDHAAKMFKRRVWAVRGMFVLCGILVIVAGGLFYGKGVVSFRNSIDDVRKGIDLVQVAAVKGIELTENVLQAGGDVEEEFKTSQNATDPSESICGLDSELSAQIRNLYGELSSNVDQLKIMLNGSLKSFGHDLQSLVTLTEEISSQLDKADIFLYILLAISIIIIVLIVAMLVGVFFACKGVSNCVTKCMQYAILWPLFVFFLVLSWIFATLFLVFSLAGSDFCVSPDQNVQTFLDSNEDMFDGIIFGFIVYYVSGCTIEPAGAEDIVAIASQAQLAVGHAHSLFELLGNLTVESVQEICGLSTQEATAVQNLVIFAHDSTHVLNRAVVGLRDVLSCATFNPIYTTFVHEALCKQGVSGLTYIFSTTLVISIFSMVMIMFRAAIYPIKEPDAQPVSKSEDAVEVLKYNLGEEDNRVPGEEIAEGDKPIIY